MCIVKLFSLIRNQLQLNKPTVASSTTQAAPVQQSPQAQPTQTAQQQKSDYVPIASNDPALTNFTIQRNTVNGWVVGVRQHVSCQLYL